jgi:hypothetical protein
MATFVVSPKGDNQQPWHRRGAVPGPNPDTDTHAVPMRNCVIANPSNLGNFMIADRSAERCWLRSAERCARVPRNVLAAFRGTVPPAFRGTVLPAFRGTSHVRRATLAGSVSERRSAGAGPIAPVHALPAAQRIHGIVASAEHVQRALLQIESASRSSRTCAAPWRTFKATRLAPPR